MLAFSELTFWHWFAAGAILMILEIFVPGAVFMWLGVAAAVTGILLWSIPGLTVEIQLIFFAVLSVIAVVIGRSVYKARKQDSDQPLLNQRGEQYVGSIYTLEDATLNGHGKVRIGDTVWSVELRPLGAELGKDEQPPDLAKGEFIKVRGVNGSTLVAEPAADRTWRNDEQTAAP